MMKAGEMKEPQRKEMSRMNGCIRTSRSSSQNFKIQEEDILQCIMDPNLEDVEAEAEVQGLPRFTLTNIPFIMYS